MAHSKPEHTFTTWKIPVTTFNMIHYATQEHNLMQPVLCGWLPEMCFQRQRAVIRIFADVTLEMNLRKRRPPLLMSSVYKVLLLGLQYYQRRKDDTKTMQFYINCIISFTKYITYTKPLGRHSTRNWLFDLIESHL